MAPLQSADDHATPDEPGAVLSPVEAYFWRSEELSRGYRAAALVRLDGCVEAEFLRPALHEIQRRHPKLRSSIVEGSDRRLRYHPLHPVQPVPFEIRDVSGQEMPWREATRDLLRVEFPAKGPYLALTVLRDLSTARSVIILVGTHGFVDGMSAQVLLNDLLAAYARAEAGEVSTDAPLPLVSAPRAAPAGTWRQCGQVLARFRSLRRSRDAMPPVELSRDPAVAPLSQWMHWVFPADETLRIVRRCRREKVSVNSMLLAAVFRSIGDTTNIAGRSMRFHSPFNVRPDLQGPNGPVQLDDIGCFMSNMNGLIPGDLQGDLWTVARYVQADNDWFTAIRGPAFGYNMASFLFGLTTFGRRIGIPVKWMSPTEERVTVLSTNYGVAPLRAAYGSLRPRACTLMFNNDTVGAYLVAEALVLGQELNVGFAASGLTESAWQQLQTSVRRYLSDAGAVAVSAVHAAAGAEAAPNAGRPRSTLPTNV